MEWKTHGRRPVYRSEWVELWLDDVEIPGVRRFEHNVLRFPRHSNTAVVIQDDKMLLIWRHRFITNTWGWEVPAGWSDPGEDPETAIRREIEEETGYRARDVTPMTSYYAITGIGDMHFTAFLALGADKMGHPAQDGETIQTDWKPLQEVRELLSAGKITDGPSITAISYHLAMHQDATDR